LPRIARNCVIFEQHYVTAQAAANVRRGGHTGCEQARKGDLAGWPVGYYDPSDEESVESAIPLSSMSTSMSRSADDLTPNARNAHWGVARPGERMADDDRKRKGEPGAPGTAVITKTKPQTKRPNLYRVLLLNDDYTPMEFVVHVLERFFNKDREAATRIMLHVHHHGIGECGIYTYEVAETKVTQVMDFARKHQHPLQCVMEKK
jgi:ATP-dependent Clp protease adaptor protein ClpS